MDLMSSLRVSRKSLEHLERPLISSWVTQIQYEVLDTLMIILLYNQPVSFIKTGPHLLNRYYTMHKSF